MGENTIKVHGFSVDSWCWECEFPFNLTTEVIIMKQDKHQQGNKQPQKTGQQPGGQKSGQDQKNKPSQKPQQPK